MLRDPRFEAGVISEGVPQGKTGLGVEGRWEMVVLGGEGHWEVGGSGFWGCCRMVSSWSSGSSPQGVWLSGTHSCPPSPPWMPGPFPVQLPHAGSCTDAGEGSWISAQGGGDSVPRLGCQGGVCAKPGFALGAGGVGSGKELSWEG